MQKSNSFKRRFQLSKGDSAKAGRLKEWAKKRIQLIPDQDMFKKIGAVLIKMDKMEIETELNGRIHFLEKNLKAIMDKI